jgi:hypothetical protein
MRLVRGTGSPFQRGVAVGEALRDDIEASVAATMAWADGRGATPARVGELLAPFDAAAARFAPDLVAVVDGMASGAGVDPVGLRAANAFEELYFLLDPAAPAAPTAPVERCTDAVLRGVDGPLLVHQEQWYAAESGHVAIVVDVPDDRTTPAVVAPVVSSTLPLVGMNASGASVGAMSLTAVDERTGVPRAFVARRALDATDRASAVGIVTTPGRAGGYSYAFAFPDGSAAIVETTATAGTEVDATAHANHALDPAVASVCPAPSDGSTSRLARMRELVATRERWTVPEAAALLTDHAAVGQDICVHPDAADGPEGSAIMFGMVADVANRTLWVAPGNPCEASFEAYPLDELIPS